MLFTNHQLTQTCNKQRIVLQGKQIVDEMSSEIGEGRSLYTLDACLEPEEEGHPARAFWETNFKQMTEKVNLTNFTNSLTFVSYLGSC